MNKLFTSLILGACMGLCLMSFTPEPIIQGSDQGSIFDNPYCPYTPPQCPFFDPCPEDSHIDADCAAACCTAYTSALTGAYSAACSAFNGFINTFDVDITNISHAYDACIAAGGSTQVCRSKAGTDTRSALDKFRHSATALHLQVANAEQAALDAYFNCILSCPCIEDPPNSIYK